jgi:TolA-binding protein
MIRRLSISVLIAVPALYGADKTTDAILELVRDVGGLQEQVKGLQKSLETKLADLGQTSADQARATADQAAKATAVLGDRLQKSIADQQNQQTKTLDAVAGLGAQLQSVSGDLSTMREALSELTSALAKLSTQVNDLGTAVKALQPPKADAAAAAQPPVLSATDLMSSAEGDYLGGKLDLALTEYAQYVSKFGNTDQAPYAQYRVAWIHYSNQEWDEAAKAFDVLLTTYPDKRAPEALYYKGDCLGKLGRWPEAMEAENYLRKHYPNDPFAKRSLNIKPPAHQ